MISEDSIKNDLKRIGIEKGDVLFITANIGATGFFYKSRNETISRWIKILTDVVGDEGTIIVAAYTKTFFRFKKDKELVFNRYMKSYVGPLSNALIEDPNSFRSSHPSMSCIGIGKYAETILSNHNSNSLSYDPIGKVIELNGKNLMCRNCRFDECTYVIAFCTTNPWPYKKEYVYFDAKTNILFR